jgi:predicted ATPase
LFASIGDYFLVPTKKQREQLSFNLGKECSPRVQGGGFLHSVMLQSLGAGWPFNLPAIRSLAERERLEFHPAVTFFVGENGSGKSTLLEAIARKYGFSPEGGWKKRATEMIASSSPLDDALRLARTRYPSDGWFLRAESFYNVATELEELDKEPFCGHGFMAYGGKSLHRQSHGEAFLALLLNRLQGDGLYLFDEPEAALSPQRQLAVLTLIHRLVYHRSQLVIATHSPILLAYPNARIYEFSAHGIREMAYTDTEHFNVTRDFLNRHDKMVETLIREEEEDLRSKER